MRGCKGHQRGCDGHKGGRYDHTGGYKGRIGALLRGHICFIGSLHRGSHTHTNAHTHTLTDSLTHSLTQSYLCVQSLEMLAELFPGFVDFVRNSKRCVRGWGWVVSDVGDGGCG